MEAIDKKDIEASIRANILVGLEGDYILGWYKFSAFCFGVKYESATGSNTLMRKYCRETGGSEGVVKETREVYDVLAINDLSDKVKLYVATEESNGFSFQAAYRNQLNPETLIIEGIKNEDTLILTIKE